jgi:hypothetical protein
MFSTTTTLQFPEAQEVASVSTAESHNATKAPGVTPSAGMKPHTAETGPKAQMSRQRPKFASQGMQGIPGFRCICPTACQGFPVPDACAQQLVKVATRPQVAHITPPCGARQQGWIPRAGPAWGIGLRTRVPHKFWRGPRVTRAFCPIRVVSMVFTERTSLSATPFAEG